MTKITPDHLAPSAFVYIRQSTTDQMLNKHESRRRQCGLRNARGSWAGVPTVCPETYAVY